MPITNSSSKRCTEIPLVKIRLTRIVFPFCSNYIIKKSNDTHTGFNVYSIHHFSCDDRHEMVVSERETKIKKSKLAVYEYNQTTHRRTSYLVVTTRPQLKQLTQHINRTIISDPSPNSVIPNTLS